MKDHETNCGIISGIPRANVPIIYSVADHLVQGYPKEE